MTVLAPRNATLFFALAFAVEAPSASAQPLPAADSVEAELHSVVTSLREERPNDAIAELESLSDRGVLDPVLSYNRGLAYAARVRVRAEQPGDLGRAVHGFEEARELSHDRSLVRDATLALTEVRAEIARRRARAGDPVELEHGIPPGRAIVMLLTEDTWTKIALFFCLLLCIGIFVRYAATARRVKVLGGTTCALSGVLLLIGVIILMSARDYRLNVREGIVVKPGARLLDARHIAMTEVLPLPEGARIRLLDDESDYARVSIRGVEGFVSRSAVLPLAKR